MSQGRWFSLVGAIIPEGGFKEFLRGQLWRRYYLPALDNIISRADLVPGDTLFVEFKDGMRLYAPRESASILLIVSLDPDRWAKMKAFEHFGTLLALLGEQYMDNIYGRHYQMQRGNVVVDVGAHIGTYAIRATRPVGDEGQVIAIEPETGNLSFLQRNIEANELRNVVIVPKAAWSASGKATLKIFEGRTAQHSFYEHVYDKDLEASGAEEVEVDTVDNMLRELGTKRVDLIKMDIEGAEIEALKGMGEVLKSVSYLFEHRCLPHCGWEGDLQDYRPRTEGKRILYPQ